MFDLAIDPAGSLTALLGGTSRSSETVGIRNTDSCSM